MPRSGRPGNSELFQEDFMKFLVTFCIGFGLLSAAASAQPVPAYRNVKLPVKQRVDDLMARMTLSEKLAQLQSQIRDFDENHSLPDSGLGGLGPVLRSLGGREAAEKANKLQKLSLEKTRLGIPFMIHDEGLHGLVGKDATSFPQAIGLASTWDTSLVHEVAGVIARETRSRGIRQLLSPVINIARDARWGRVEETYGEDPLLTSRMGVAFCRGLYENGVISTPKHFAANVGDGGRDSYPVHFSERLLREVYFPAFKACVQEGHAGSVMAAYNALDGIPCSANPWLLTDLLRKEWGFTGFVVSDYGSVSGIMSMHHTAPNEKETARLALTAGLDVELPGIYIYGKGLHEAALDGSVSRAVIDRAARRILESKFRLGLFDHPFVDPNQAAELADAPQHRALALKAALESAVLIKNEGNLLPLKNVSSIAVLGPNADSPQLGGYSGFDMKIVTLLQGIIQKVPSSTIVRYAKGCEVGSLGLPAIPEKFLSPANPALGKSGLQASYFNNKDLTGEPDLTRLDRRLDFDWGSGSPDSAIHRDHFSARWSGKLIPPESGDYRLALTTDDGGRLFLDGKMLVDSWFDRAPATDFVRVHLDANHAYDLRVEFYENEGGAYAALGWDYKSGADTALQHAVDIAKKSDVAIIAAGILEGEGNDRSNLDLPGLQEDLIRKVAETGTPTVVVLIAGAPVTMVNWMDKAGAILEAWYPGEEGGEALADILLGDVNPSGHLPLTFPQSVGQVPLYYNHKPTGRGDDYVDLTGKPLFPFGYGLSYSSFEYSNLHITPESVRPTGKVTVSADVMNVSSRAGDEVVQLYLRDSVASVTRPVKELKGFRRISLKPGEKKSVSFDLSAESLSLYDRNMKFVVELGEFVVMIGRSSDDIRLRGSFTVVR